MRDKSQYGLEKENVKYADARQKGSQASKDDIALRQSYLRAGTFSPGHRIVDGSHWAYSRWGEVVLSVGALD